MSVYCPNKFNYLKVDIEKRLLYNCHKAHPQQITSEWLKNNTGKIFNTDLMVEERKQMLANIKNKSCSFQCYKAEDRGGISHRMQVLESNKTYYDDPKADIEHLDLVLSTDCNLSCVYCSGIFSSTWRREMKKFGSFKDVPSIEHDVKWNQFYNLVSQKEKIKTSFVDLFINEIRLMKKLKKISITGGEPLLSNHLDVILNAVSDDVCIDFITGLGVSPRRFEKFIDMLSNRKNTKVTISAETLGKFYEFNRYGSKFKTFEKYLNVLDSNNINYNFITTVSNVTMFGLHDFYKRFNQLVDLNYNHCEYPIFLQKHILDQQSKETLINLWSKNNDVYSKYVITGLEHNPTDIQKYQLKMYLKQIQERRSVSLDIFPKTFLQWLGI